MWRIVKSFFVYANKYQSRRPIPINKLKRNRNDKEKAEAFNHFFVSMSQKPYRDEETPSQEEIDSQNETLKMVHISTLTVPKIIQGRNTKKASGPDNISTQATSTEIGGTHYQHSMQFGALASMQVYSSSFCWIEFYLFLIIELQHNPWSD